MVVDWLLDEYLLRDKLTIYMEIQNMCYLKPLVWLDCLDDSMILVSYFTTTDCEMP
jgi:hypothetical protein